MENQTLFAYAFQHQSLKTRSRQMIKIKTFSRKFFWNRCYFGLSREVMNVTSCHSSCQRSAMLWGTLLSLRPISCCRCLSKYAVSQFFSATFTSTLLTPPPLPTHGHLYSPQFRSPHRETKMALRRTQRSISSRTCFLSTQIKCLRSQLVSIAVLQWMMFSIFSTMTSLF